jgi:pilus assembly protein CpaF
VGLSGGTGVAAAALPSAALADRIIEDEVRELVRRRGLDPLQEPDAIRRLVDEVINDYEERSLIAALPALGDRTEAARVVTDVVAGFGPLQRHLDDPTVEELWINEPGRVFVARHGRSELTNTILTDTQVRDIVERMLKSTGRRVDLSSPFVDAMLPDGSRLHVVIPDITRRHWSVNVRKFVMGATDLDELIAAGELTSHAARFLEAAVVSGLNIIIAGGTQAGKTTLLNCLASCIPGRERVITCEEVFELKLRVPDWVAMQTRQPNLEGTGEIRLRRLVKEALRMRPDRLIVGEVRQEEALDLLIALNSGLPGMCTLHANSAREAVSKLCTLPLLAGENVGSAFVVPTVATAIDLVVHVAKDGHGHRQVREIVALSGRVEGGVVSVTQLFGSRNGDLIRADGYPPHLERFSAAGFDIVSLLNVGALSDVA